MWRSWTVPRKRRDRLYRTIGNAAFFLELLFPISTASDIYSSADPRNRHLGFRAAVPAASNLSPPRLWRGTFPSNKPDRSKCSEMVTDSVWTLSPFYKVEDCGTPSADCLFSAVLFAWKLASPLARGVRSAESRPRRIWDDLPCRWAPPAPSQH